MAERVLEIIEGARARGWGGGGGGTIVQHEDTNISEWGGGGKGDQGAREGGGMFPQCPCVWM